MTRAVFQEDSYLTELNATVVAAGDNWIELDQTIFYPEGGGQPGDQGTICSNTETVRVIDTRKGESPGTVRHLFETTHGFRIGGELQMKIDWERR